MRIAVLGAGRIGSFRARAFYVSDFVGRFADTYREEMEHLVRAVREDGEPEVSGADDATAFALSKTAECSYREGKTVR